MKTIFTLLLFVSLILFVGCKTDETHSTSVIPIVGSNGDTYYLVSKEIKPTQENGWVGKVASYRKDGDDTKHILVSDGPPPTFKDINIPLDD